MRRHPLQILGLYLAISCIENEPPNARRRIARSSRSLATLAGDGHIGEAISIHRASIGGQRQNFVYGPSLSRGYGLSVRRWYASERGLQRPLVTDGNAGVPETRGSFDGTVDLRGVDVPRELAIIDLTHSRVRRPYGVQ